MSLAKHEFSFFSSLSIYKKSCRLPADKRKEGRKIYPEEREKEENLKIILFFFLFINQKI